MLLLLDLFDNRQQGQIFYVGIRPIRIIWVMVLFMKFHHIFLFLFLNLLVIEPGDLLQLYFNDVVSLDKIGHPDVFSLGE